MVTDPNRLWSVGEKVQGPVTEGGADANDQLLFSIACYALLFKHIFMLLKLSVCVCVWGCVRERVILVLFFFSFIDFYFGGVIIFCILHI